MTHIEKSFLSACMNNNNEVVEDFLNNSLFDPTFNRHFVFISCCSLGHVIPVKLLLKHPKIDPSFNDNDGIILAAKSGHYRTVQVLLEHPNVNPSDQYDAALYEASRNKSYNIVNTLLSDNRVNPKSRQHHLLFNSIFNITFTYDNIKTITYLMNNVYREYNFNCKGYNHMECFATFWKFSELKEGLVHYLELQGKKSYIKDVENYIMQKNLQNF